MFTGDASVDKLMGQALLVDLRRKDGSPAVRQISYLVTEATAPRNMRHQLTLGQYDYALRAITIRPKAPWFAPIYVNWSPSEVLLSLFHEMGHAYMGHGRAMVDLRIEEAQAESIAMLCYEYFMGKQASREYLDDQLECMGQDQLHKLALSVPLLAEAAYAIIRAFQESGWSEPSPRPAESPQARPAAPSSFEQTSVVVRPDLSLASPAFPAPPPAASALREPA